MNNYLVYLLSYLMLFGLISNISNGETRGNDPSMNEHEMSQPIVRSTGKGLKTIWEMQT